VSDKEKLKKIRDLVKDCNPNFDYNYERSHEWGIAIGAHQMKLDILSILNK